MTVGELIEKLKKFPSMAPVFMIKDLEFHQYRATPINEVEGINIFEKDPRVFHWKGKEDDLRQIYYTNLSTTRFQSEFPQGKIVCMWVSC